MRNQEYIDLSGNPKSRPQSSYLKWILGALFVLGVLVILLSEHPIPQTRQSDVPARIIESNYYHSNDSNSSRSANKNIDDIHYDAYSRDMERQGLDPKMQSEAEVRAVNKLLRDKGKW